MASGTIKKPMFHPSKEAEGNPVVTLIEGTGAILGLSYGLRLGVGIIYGIVLGGASGVVADVISHNLFVAGGVGLGGFGVGVVGQGVNVLRDFMPSKNEHNARRKSSVGY